MSWSHTWPVICARLADDNYRCQHPKCGPLARCKSYAKRCTRSLYWRSSSGLCSWQTLCLRCDSHSAHYGPQAGAQCIGAMAHVRLTNHELATWSDTELCIAAINGVTSNEQLSVTLCGPEARVDEWVATHDGATMLKPPHPWHHAMYLDVPQIHNCSLFDAPVC